MKISNLVKKKKKRVEKSRLVIGNIGLDRGECNVVVIWEKKGVFLYVMWGWCICYKVFLLLLINVFI